MTKKIRAYISLGLVSLILVLGGCAPSWAFSMNGPQGEEILLNHETWRAYADFAGEQGISLEQILYGYGHRIIDKVTFTDQEGNEFSYPWGDIAEDVWLQENGEVVIDEGAIRPASLAVEPSPWVSNVEASICDIAPTAAKVLGIPAPEIATGRTLTNQPASHVLLLFLDAFGYLRYAEALEAGLIPELAALDPPLVGITTYPPITTVSTASLLTGAEPPVHGVETRGIRKTDQGTLLESAANEGLQVTAVEGEALAFQLSGADFQLSGDRDGDGGTDDNVLANTLAILEEGMPDVFYVHFHGIDDMGHEVGPGAAREEEKIREVDQALGQILDRLPPDTLVVIFADHGMHKVEGEEREGNHGNLIDRDMLIPIWITYLD
ncbi:MAG: alkaline phosphatase family protein [Anaerolineales bacterium]